MDGCWGSGISSFPTMSSTSNFPTFPIFIMDAECPICPAPVVPNYTVTLEKLVYWTIGYGGWLGMALMPVIWRLPIRGSVMIVLSCAAPPLCGIVMTGFFSAIYAAAYLIYTVSSIMVDPLFLKSCVGSCAIGLGSIALYFVTMPATFNLDKLVAEDDAKETQHDDESDDTSEGDSDAGSDAGSDHINDEFSEEANDDDGSDVGSDDANEEEEESDVGSEVSASENSASSSPSDTWRETADFDRLRTAPPLPTNDS